MTHLVSQRLSIGCKRAPANARAKLSLKIDPISKAIVKQDLIVWWSGNPSQSLMTLQLDDGPEFAPDWTWENPGVTERAIVRIGGDFIPEDGVNHRLTVRIRWLHDGAPYSDPAIVQVVGGVKRQPPAEQAEWCGATLIRQSTADTDALVFVQWRHTGAVKLIAKTRLIPQLITVGYADADESTMIVDDLGAKLSNSADEVTIGVCTIEGGQFGPPLWCNPIILKQFRKPVPILLDPDKLTRAELSQSDLSAHVVNQLKADPLTNINRVNLVGANAIRYLTLRIKDALTTGGSVKLDDFGRFEARWNPDRTLRSPAFVPSPGLTEGTRQGRVMTDAETKP